MTELVKLARKWYDEDADNRNLRRAVATDLEAIAKGERVSDTDVGLGLELATATVAKYGLPLDGLVQKGFDADAAADAVINCAKDEDRNWGREPHYDMAERAIRVVYTGLVRRYNENDPLLMASMGWMHEHLVNLANNQSAVAESLGELVAASSAVATEDDVRAYLHAQIRRWNETDWHPRTRQISELEQRLRVRTTDDSNLRSWDLVAAEDALDGASMLVVLGGPGSGKTWLAKRYARQAAERALEDLDAGMRLDKVEIPLLTTWDHWARFQAADLREGLVQASTSRGIDDLDDDFSMPRLRRALTRPKARILMIVDSLDEAADRFSQAGQRTRLRDLVSVAKAGWRVVVTSRVGAWEASQSGSGSAAREVELEPMEYPKDVTAFVCSWFEDEHDRADHLLAEIRDRSELRRLASVPLFLTFYCLLAEEDGDIPSLRRELYTRLTNRLLTAAWSNDPPLPPDLGHCHRLLLKWAWSAVEDAITPSGIGNWPEAFTQPSRPRPEYSRAIDHVAPRVFLDGEGNITRRFVHRTLLEHYVAEHLAGMDVETAAVQLLPHLWFDPDWEVAAPAAIAAHSDRSLLLERLLGRKIRSSDPIGEAASAETDRLLLRIGAESAPYDWSPEQAARIETARIRRAIEELSLVTETNHWTDSNREVSAAIIAALPEAGIHYGAEELPEALVTLASTDEQRREALAEIMAAVPTIGPKGLATLAAALM
ncbi:MAG: NACHT domain-containing protein, partial [Demequinaceae bacterium]|nr:NACHT domain-containing protein [Demequinaceae bacterium]